MSEGTPGPWRAVGTKGRIPWQVEEWDRGVIADVVNEADARRIAAAPDLLEALEAVKMPDGCWCYQGYFAPHQAQCLKAQAAIAKAKGETV